MRWKNLGVGECQVRCVGLRRKTIRQTEEDVEGCRDMYLSCIVAGPIVPVATSSSTVTSSL